MPSNDLTSDFTEKTKNSNKLNMPFHFNSSNFLVENKSEEEQKYSNAQLLLNLNNQLELKNDNKTVITEEKNELNQLNISSAKNENSRFHNFSENHSLILEHSPISSKSSFSQELVINENQSFNNESYVSSTESAPYASSIDAAKTYSESNNSNINVCESKNNLNLKLRSLNSSPNKDDEHLSIENSSSPSSCLSSNINNSSGIGSYVTSPNHHNEFCEFSRSPSSESMSIQQQINISYQTKLKNFENSEILIKKRDGSVGSQTSSSSNSFYGTNKEKKDFLDQSFSSCIKHHDNFKKEVIPQRKRRDFIPNELKDEHYWERRRKNNLAAKRSREKRRLNDIVLEKRVLELTNLNNVLKLKLDLCTKKFGFSDEDIEQLFEENRHLLIIQDSLEMNEFNSNDESHGLDNEQMSVSSSSSSSSNIKRNRLSNKTNISNESDQILFKNECYILKEEDLNPNSDLNNFNSIEKAKEEKNINKLEENLSVRFSNSTVGTEIENYDYEDGEILNDTNENDNFCINLYQSENLIKTEDIIKNINKQETINNSEETKCYKNNINCCVSEALSLTENKFNKFKENERIDSPPSKRMLLVDSHKISNPFSSTNTLAKAVIVESASKCENQHNNMEHLNTTLEKQNLNSENTISGNNLRVMNMEPLSVELKENNQNNIINSKAKKSSRFELEKKIKNQYPLLYNQLCKTTFKANDILNKSMFTEITKDIIEECRNINNDFSNEAFNIDESNITKNFKSNSLANQLKNIPEKNYTKLNNNPNNKILTKILSSALPNNHVITKTKDNFIMERLKNYTTKHNDIKILTNKEENKNKINLPFIGNQTCSINSLIEKYKNLINKTNNNSHNSTNQTKIKNKLENQTCQTILGINLDSNNKNAANNLLLSLDLSQNEHVDHSENQDKQEHRTYISKMDSSSRKRHLNQIDNNDFKKVESYSKELNVQNNSKSIQEVSLKTSKSNDINEIFKLMFSSSTSGLAFANKQIIQQQISCINTNFKLNQSNQDQNKILVDNISNEKNMLINQKQNEGHDQNNLELNIRKSIEINHKNIEIYNSNSSSNMNSNVDNMPLKLRFKLSQLKMGEVS